MKTGVKVLFVSLIFALSAHSQTAWGTKLDSDIRFYQTTDFGIVVAGTEKSLYALDGRSGNTLWRIKTGKINETAVLRFLGSRYLMLLKYLFGI